MSRWPVPAAAVRAASPAAAVAESATASAGAVVLHGIDFSGGERPEGKIWVATRDGRTIELRRGFDHRSIVEMILASRDDGRDHLWRIDAPFGLALESLGDFGIEPSWQAMAEWLGSFGSAREWRSTCRAMARREPRRVTDREAHTPMSPLNLRVFKQTWSVITRVLKPLAEAGIRIEPVAGPLGSRVVVAEGCPASVLHQLGWPARGYKGGGPASGNADDPPRSLRRELVERLRKTGLPIPRPVAGKAIDDREGDGLDALLLVTDPRQDVPPREALVEAWVG